MQGLLELADLPYVGAGVLASAVSMDKEMMKRVCKERMLPVVDYVTVSREQARTSTRSANGCLSPCSSSRPISARRSEFRRPTTPASWKPRSRWPRSTTARSSSSAASQGRELECAVLGNEAPDRFPALRDSALARVLRLRGQVPARPGARPSCPPIFRRRRPTSCAAWRWSATARWSAKAWRRVDFLLERATDKLYINEINTIPGFTSHQHVPQDVGAQRRRLFRADRPADRAGAGPPQAEEGHAVHAVR